MQHPRDIILFSSVRLGNKLVTFNVTPDLVRYLCKILVLLCTQFLYRALKFFGFMYPMFVRLFFWVLNVFLLFSCPLCFEKFTFRSFLSIQWFFSLIHNGVFFRSISFHPGSDYFIFLKVFTGNLRNRTLYPSMAGMQITAHVKTSNGFFAWVWGILFQPSFKQ